MRDCKLICTKILFLFLLLLVLLLWEKILLSVPKSFSSYTLSSAFSCLSYITTIEGCTFIHTKISSELTLTSLQRKAWCGRPDSWTCVKGMSLLGNGLGCLPTHSSSTASAKWLTPWLTVMWQVSALVPRLSQVQHCNISLWSLYKRKLKLNKRGR